LNVANADPDRLRAWLEPRPRVVLGHLPTPLEPLDRLSRELGGPRIWLKRDDCTGLATGGNKTRKLEYLLGTAIEQDARAIVTFGAVQSNHARQTAAACARFGLACHLVLARQVSWPHPAYESGGNVLLDDLFAANVHIVAADEAVAYGRSLIGDLRAEGLNPYVIPGGGSNGTGALGYARAALELITEAPFTLTDVVHATSSAGTQAGLLLGFACANSSVRVHGINVYTPDRDSVAANVARICSEADPALVPAPNNVLIDQRYLGDGYGLPTPATLDAIRMVAELEGVLLDPVYSGKAMSGLIDRIAIGDLHDVENVVFVHTGGTAVLAVYDGAFTAPRAR
jgi:L-cysteate sulfo-lyase